jgi:diguanylate cyclase (GGDEF)-like protein
MISADRRKTEAASGREFQESLAILDRNASWLLWSGIAGLLLPSTAVVLLSLSWPQPSLKPLDEASVGWFVRGLLTVMIVISIVTMRSQRRLKHLRNRLVTQMDAATKHRVQAERFYEMSIIDPLTGLYNRRFGETRLREEIVRAEKSGDPLMLLAFDFDHFKEINDRYGHAAGDLALKAFSRRLQRALRACDVPIRVGGDEFLVILPECPADKVQTVLSRLDAIDFNLDGEKVRVSFSQGVAQYQINDTAERIIKRADERLYAAKANRPGGATVKDAEQENVLESQNYEAPS